MSQIQVPKKIWGVQHFLCRLRIEKFPVDDEFDKNLVLIWGYWVKKVGIWGLGTPSSPPLIDNDDDVHMINPEK